MDDVQALEEELRRGLRHVSAPEGFTRRVMEQVAQRDAAREAADTMRMKRRMAAGAYRHLGWWTAAAAGLAIAVAGGNALHLRQQREAEQSLAAQAQVDLAMQLTGHALNEVELGLDRSLAGRFTRLLNGTR